MFRPLSPVLRVIELHITPMGFSPLIKVLRFVNLERVSVFIAHLLGILGSIVFKA
jgi:hypothetical protein